MTTTMEKLDYYPAPALSDDDPAFQKLVAAMGKNVKPNEARGALDKVYFWMNFHGKIDGKTEKKLKDFSKIAGHKRFGQAALETGFIELDEKGEVHILLNEKHIGLQAKKRKGDAGRKRAERWRRKCHSDSHSDCSYIEQEQYNNKKGAGKTQPVRTQDDETTASVAQPATEEEQQAFLEEWRKIGE